MPIPRLVWDKVMEFYKIYPTLVRRSDTFPLQVQQEQTLQRRGRGMCIYYMVTFENCISNHYFILITFTW